MSLIRLLFHYVLQHSLGLSFAERKVASKRMSFNGIEVQGPTIYTVRTTSKHDSTVMPTIPYEPAYYIFDRAYDSFKELYKIHLTDSYYVV